MPKTDSIVEVTTSYRTNTLNADKNGFKTFKTKGKVIAPPKWIKGDEFALQHDFMSIIHLGHVTDIKILKGSSVDIQSYVVEGKGGKYQIIRNGQHYSCNCIGFKYHAKCKHITSIKSMA